ncbi:MAG: T9SS type A sorting domain-containing protein [Lentimicrobium sp.]|jgi:hypothetical protein|nr:T9SS type A sorting domain-containing protein [Lentimicrobium sp.]
MKYFAIILAILISSGSVKAQWHSLQGFAQPYHFGGLEVDLSPDNSLYVASRYAEGPHQYWSYLYKSNNGGESWSSIYYSSYTSTFLIDCIGPNQLVFSNTDQVNTNFEISSDDFNTYTIVPGCDGAPAAMSFVNLNFGVFTRSFGPSEAIGVVNEGEVSLYPIDTLQFVFSAVQSLSDSIAFVLCRDTHAPYYNLSRNNLVLRTLDGGTNWTIFYSSELYNISHFYFSSAEEGILVGQGGGILSTTDAGANWITENSGTDLDINHITSRNGLFFCAGKGGLILRKNAGETNWEDISYGSSDYRKIMVDSNLIGYLLTTNDQILRSDYILETANWPYLEDVRIYPNPTSDFLTIEIPPDNNNSIIEIINIQGVVVKKLRVSDYNQRLDVRNLSNGLYIIKVLSDKGIRVAKMIKR